MLVDHLREILKFGRIEVLLGPPALGNAGRQEPTRVASSHPGSAGLLLGYGCRAAEISSAALARAQRSAVSMSSSARDVWGPACSFTTRSIVSTIAGNDSRPSRKALTHCSFAAL